MAVEGTEPATRLLPGRVGLFIRLTSRPGGRAAVLDALHTYLDRLREEPGTEGFLVSLDPDDPDAVWMHEWFVDADALEDHRRAPAFGDMMESLPQLLAGPAGMLRVDPLRLHLAASLLEGLGEPSGP